MPKERIIDQHTAPACYLRNFSQDGHTIFRKFKYPDVHLPRNKELLRAISIKSATIKKDFYTIDSGTDPMMIEKRVYAEKLENFYPNVYKLLTGDSINFSMNDRADILHCLLSLHPRTPKQHNQFVDQISKDQDLSPELLREFYKSEHVKKTLTSMVEAHQFKVIEVISISDTSQFITSDNPILIMGSNGVLKDSQFKEQFNIANIIAVPLDTKNICLLKNLIVQENKRADEVGVFYNKILKKKCDISLVQHFNFNMIRNADKYIFGSEEYLNGLFSLVDLS